jgi:hypothetical protein
VLLFAGSIRSEKLSSEGQRRRTLRFSLQTAVSFWWKNGNGDLQTGEGHSRDLSEHGAFVISPSCPPIGANVVLKIALKRAPNEIKALRVELEGQVRRVEGSPSETGDAGFAIEY